MCKRSQNWIAYTQLFRFGHLYLECCGFPLHGCSEDEGEVKYADRLFVNGTAIALQETHDDGDTRCNDFFQLHSDSFVFFQSALYSAAGGVLIAIRKCYLDLFTERQEYKLAGCWQLP